MSDEPNLGLASTRQLLEELRARGEVQATIDPDCDVEEAERFLYPVRRLIESLPDRLLDYRTVDSR